MNPATVLKTTALQYICPYCSATLKILVEFAGISAPCPNCHAPLTAPSFGLAPLKSLPAPETGLPVEKRFNETPEQPEFSDRIVNPNIGVQSPSEEQKRNIQNAPPLTARPRPARRQDGSDYQDTTLATSADNFQIYKPTQTTPQAVHKTSPTPPQSIASLSPEEARERNLVVMSHKKDLEGCIKLLTACVYKLENSDLLS